ncbi:MAG TPA: hypothetical protein VF809_00405 [Candidatus Saccharimonadales bacterium]
MDFLHRNANNQPQTVRSNGNGQPGGVSAGTSKVKDGIVGEPGWLRAATVILLFSLTVLAIAVTSLFYFGRNREAQYVNKDRVQAVFLTNGQVYFGNVKAITNQYLDLQNIYYLNSQTDSKSTTDSTSFALVKLGCELHGPLDQMVINREQVSFWENLSDTGKVAKAIDEWVSQNPNGQKCETTSASTQQSTGTTEDAATGTTTTTKTKD